MYLKIYGRRRVPKSQLKELEKRLRETERVLNNRDRWKSHTRSYVGRPTVPSKVQWLSDNVSCYTARETVAFGNELGLDIRTILPYSPESKAMAEAFVRTFKRDYVWFGDLKDPQTVKDTLTKRVFKRI